MRASIKIDRAIDGTKPFGMEGGDLARDGIDFFPDAQVGRATPDVVRRVRTALPLRQRHQRSTPGIAPHASRFVDWDAEIVSEFRAGYALGLVFVKARGPFAGEIYLGEGGNDEQVGGYKTPDRQAPE